jgi:hypothetical protein
MVLLPWTPLRVRRDVAAPSLAGVVRVPSRFPTDALQQDHHATLCLAFHAHTRPAAPASAVYQPIKKIRPDQIGKRAAKKEIPSKTIKQRHPLAGRRACHPSPFTLHPFILHPPLSFVPLLSRLSADIIILP